MTHQKPEGEMTADLVGLKPCPFCGGGPVLASPHAVGSRLSAVYCESCEIKGPLMAYPPLAIERWNTRASDAAIKHQQEVIEALVECHIRRGPFDEPLGSSEQAPSINAAVALLATMRAKVEDSSDGE